MAQKQGKYTIKMDNPPSIIGFSAIGSKMESQGPLAKYFDVLNEDAYFGTESFEKAESSMQKLAVDTVLKKTMLSPEQIDFIFAGDLLNQCIGTTYGLRDLGIAFIGLYGACSTMAESLAMAGIFVEGGIATNAVACTSSHFCSAERQFRFPLEYGGQRTPTSQWTATAAGSVVVAKNVSPPYIKAITIGTIEDLGIKDANNMGAAMAPAAAATLKHFFEDTLTNPDNYDLILTGDLGQVGTDLLYDLMKRDGYDLTGKHSDAGLLLYDRDKQDVHAGASGCGCSASVLCGYILPSVKSGRIKELLFIATGALMSTTSVQQGESIPSIAHLIHISANG